MNNSSSDEVADGDISVSGVERLSPSPPPTAKPHAPARHKKKQKHKVRTNRHKPTKQTDHYTNHENQTTIKHDPQTQSNRKQFKPNRTATAAKKSAETKERLQGKQRKRRKRNAAATNRKTNCSTEIWELRNSSQNHQR